MRVSLLLLARRPSLLDTDQIFVGCEHEKLVLEMINCFSGHANKGWGGQFGILKCLCIGVMW